MWVSTHFLIILCYKNLGVIYIIDFQFWEMYCIFFLKIFFYKFPQSFPVQQFVYKLTILAVSVQVMMPNVVRTFIVGPCLP